MLSYFQSKQPVIHPDLLNHTPSRAASPNSKSRRWQDRAGSFAMTREMLLEQQQQDKVEWEMITAKYVVPDLQKISVRLKDRFTPDDIANTILADIQHVSQQVFQVWNSFITLIPHAVTHIAAHQKSVWDQQWSEQWSTFCFRESYQIEDRWRIADANM